MKCSHCNQPYEGNGILITVDGDFVCSTNCEEEWKKERDHFFHSVVHSEAATIEWLLGNG